MCITRSQRIILNDDNTVVSASGTLLEKKKEKKKRKGDTSLIDNDSVGTNTAVTAAAADYDGNGMLAGEVPIWLEGSLYRNGPGIFKVGNTHLRHLFDGFAILHRFHLSKGKVTYMSRVLDTDTWQESVKANRLVATQFGTFRTRDPCKSIFARSVIMLIPLDLKAMSFH